MTADEGGFTLVELIVAISILAIITVAVTEAALIGLRTTDATTQRVTESAGAQNAANYFLTDAQSAISFTPGSGRCDNTTTATFAWTEHTSSASGTARAASYACTSAGELIRTSYASGAATGQQHLVSDVTSLSLSCASSCSAPSTVTLRVTTCTARVAGKGCAAGDALTYELTGHPRTGA